LDGNQSEVVDQSDFLLYKRFSVAHAREQTVVAGFSIGALANFFFRDKERTTCGLVGVLRTIGHQGGVTLIDEGRYVNDEGGADIGVEAGVDDLEGAVRFQLHGNSIVRGRLGIDFGEAGEKASFVTERGDDGVIGMARLAVGKNNDAGAQLSQHAHDFQAIFKGVGDGAVGQVERLTPANAEQSRGLVGFAGAIFGGAAGSGFTLGEIENGGAQTARRHAQEGAAAGLLHIVAVGGYSENVGLEGGIGHGK